MRQFLLIGCFILNGCSLDNNYPTSQKRGVGIFPERTVLPGSNAERTKEMRRDIMSGQSPRW